MKHDWDDPEWGQKIACRVLFVFSTADQKVARKTREKSVAKLRAGLEQIQRSVAEGRRHSDATAIARRVSKLWGQRQAAGYFRYELLPLTPEEQKQWQPQRGCRRPEHRFVFHYDQAAAERDAACDGYSALVTTAPLARSADELFHKYKEQCYSELANHELKTPLAVHPVFLKSPHRAHALIFLMLIALTAYFLVQRLYRQQLPKEAKPKDRRTTTHTILQAFSNYTLLLHPARLGRVVQATRLTTRQRELLEQLGFPTPAQILSRRLPRAP